MTPRCGLRDTTRRGLSRCERRFCLGVALAAVLSGCAPFRLTADAHCASYLHGEWKTLPGAPANSKELLQLSAREGGTVTSRLHTAVPFREAWYSKGDKALLVCRYHPVRDTCRDESGAVEFTFSDGEWAAGRLDQKLCHVAL